MFSRYIMPKMLATAMLLPALAQHAQAGSPATLRQDRFEAYNSMQAGANTRAPFAFIRYCVASPHACRTSEARTLAWTPEDRRLVSEVNIRVNRSIRPQNDQGRDRWNANVTVGDCEEFALTKRERLIKAGLPASALRMAVATTRSGEGHAVLVVSTHAGDFILDNRSDRIALWHETDLTFLKIASPEDPRLWNRLA